MFDRNSSFESSPGPRAAPTAGDQGATVTTMSTHYDRETLIDYLHGALTPDADAAAFAHLHDCPECNAVYDEEAALGGALRSAARSEELESPPLVKARGWDALRREKPTWTERLRAVWGPRVAVPVAAAVALA